MEATIQTCPCGKPLTPLESAKLASALKYIKIMIGSGDLYVNVQSPKSGKYFKVHRYCSYSHGIELYKLDKLHYKEIELSGDCTYDK